MRVDAHHHLWDLSVRPQAWLDDPSLVSISRSFLIEDYERLAAAAGIERSVLVETVNVAEETDELLHIAEASPIVSAVVGWVDLTATDVAARLGELGEHRNGRWLRGIRHQVQLEQSERWLCRDDVRRGLAAVAAADLAYELVVLPQQLPAVAETVSALPEVRFVLAHCGKPPIASGDLTDWTAQIGAIAAAPNVTCKLSGLVTEADWQTWEIADLRPVVDVVLDTFGPERLMLGTDWPVCLLAGDGERVLSAYQALVSDLSVDERAAVEGGTAAEVYRLS